LVQTGLIRSPSEMRGRPVLVAASRLPLSPGDRYSVAGHEYDDTRAHLMAGERSGWNAIMQYSFLRVFANDGLIDADELAMLQRLALEDQVVDDRERAVLSSVFAKVDHSTLDPGVRDDIERFKAQYAIP
jgi:hypothetical protein